MLKPVYSLNNFEPLIFLSASIKLSHSWPSALPFCQASWQPVLLTNCLQLNSLLQISSVQSLLRLWFGKSMQTSSYSRENMCVKQESCISKVPEARIWPLHWLFAVWYQTSPEGGTQQTANLSPRVKAAFDHVQKQKLLSLTYWTNTVINEWHICSQTWQNQSNSWRVTTRDAVTESASHSTVSHARRRYIKFTDPRTTEQYLFPKK
jgi:hypothetical protein